MLPAPATVLSPRTLGAMASSPCLRPEPRILSPVPALHPRSPKQTAGSRTFAVLLVVLALLAAVWGAGDARAALGKGTVLTVVVIEKGQGTPLEYARVAVRRGSATVAGGAGANSFIFTAGLSGGGAKDVIADFGSSAANQVILKGYGSSAVTLALAGQSHSASGTTITLSDNTTITFTGVTSLDASSFRLIGSATS